MAQERQCSECGGRLAADAPQGLCPQCLMKLGLGTDANVTIGGSGQIETPGTIVGRYKLLEEIGEGGMAIVYMAEQTEPIRRKVALKIIKLGMDTHVPPDYLPDANIRLSLHKRLASVADEVELENLTGEID